jgi:hypothetical protein
MTTITTRVTSATNATVKGSALSNAEVDQNFININAGKLEVSGGTLTGAITFAAGQSFPIPDPVAMALVFGS